jgi:p-cumic alcohol dehydrogenase
MLVAWSAPRRAIRRDTVRHQGRKHMIVENKVVLITGAARGLGREYAVSLAAAGARVVAGDVLDCTATVAAATEAGGQAIGVTLDVTDMDSAAAMAGAALDAYGTIDALVNNAALYGALRGGRFNAIAEAAWDAAMAVNVKGIWNCCKAVVEAMRAAGGGSIVNVASLAATYGMPYALHYTTSKAAVIGLTRGLARELGRDNIRVNALAPSAVLTEGTDEFLGEKRDRALEVIRAGQSIPRTLVPADLTGTVAWLISDASRFVTGQTIAVDGGTVLL